MLEPFSVPFVDVKGKVRRIYSLPLFDRRYFLQLLSAAREACGDRAFLSAYDDENSNFRAIVDECLLLHRISPADVDAYIAERLLLGMGDEKPILIELNYPQESQDDSEEIPENLDPVAYSAATLWSQENLLDALRIAREQPWREVAAVLRAKAYQIEQAEPDRHKARNKTRKEVQEMARSGKLQELMQRSRGGTRQFVEVDPDLIR